MKILIALFLSSLFLAGCASDESDRRAHKTTAPVDNAVDPVSGQHVRTDSDWKTYWKGSWFYFASKENLELFESHPTAYVGADGRVYREIPRREQYPVNPNQVR